MRAEHYIFQFAAEYLELFRAADTPVDILASHFAVARTALGFEMDDGAALRDAFPNG